MNLYLYRWGCPIEHPTENGIGLVVVEGGFVFHVTARSLLEAQEAAEKERFRGRLDPMVEGPPLLIEKKAYQDICVEATGFYSASAVEEWEW